MAPFEVTKQIAKSLKWIKYIPFLPILIDEQLKVFTLFFRPQTFQAMILFTKFVKSLEGVQTKYHRYGGLEFKVNLLEFGHMHGDGLVDLRFNREIKDILVSKGLASEHHVLKRSGWISFSIRSEADLLLIKNLTFLAYQWRKDRDIKLLAIKLDLNLRINQIH